MSIEVRFVGTIELDVTCTDDGVRAMVSQSDDDVEELPRWLSDAVSDAVVNAVFAYLAGRRDEGDEE